MNWLGILGLISIGIVIGWITMGMVVHAIVEKYSNRND